MQTEEFTAAPGFAAGARQRRKVGWIRVAGLGVATVIGGSFSGWNFGLSAGWTGFAIATGLMVLLYLSLVLVIAELSACLPSTGGLYAYVRVAFGRMAGFMVGMSVACATLVASAAVATFVGGYLQSLFDWPVAPTIVGLFALFAVVHWFSTHETLSVLLIVTCISVSTLVLFGIAMAPAFKIDNLAGAGTWMPEPNAIAGAIPFAIWLLAGVEHTALAAEDVENPGKNLPRGMICAIMLLAVIGLAVATLAPGGGGLDALKSSANPLVDALQAAHVAQPLTNAIGFLALPALLAGFFSLMFAYSRQTFALARAGYLPAFLAIENRHGVPVNAVYLPGAAALILSLNNPGDTLVVAAVFLILLVYVGCFASYFWFRARAAHLSRPYRAPAGRALAALGLFLTALAIYSCTQLAPRALLVALAFLAAASIYLRITGNSRIDADVAEERMAADAHAREVNAATR